MAEKKSTKKTAKNKITYPRLISHSFDGTHEFPVFELGRGASFVPFGFWFDPESKGSFTFFSWFPVDLENRKVIFNCRETAECNKDFAFELGFKEIAVKQSALKCEEPEEDNTEDGREGTEDCDEFVDPLSDVDDEDEDADDDEDSVCCVQCRTCSSKNIVDFLCENYGF